MTMSLEEALGTLIRALNPYTDGSPGTMKLDVSDIQVEIDDYHEERGAWMFKSQPSRIQRALRIQYRHTMKGAAGDAGVTPTEYLLIGYAGSNGGG
jgi:hypothetical protein